MRYMKPHPRLPLARCVDPYCRGFDVPRLLRANDPARDLYTTTKQGKTHA
jgi:hypothetical protein